MKEVVRQIGDFSCAWGESLCWDDRQERLYFVDCATRKLIWLDGAEPPFNQLQLDSLPTGIGLCDDGRVILALDDGLHLIGVDRGKSERLTAYPEGLGGRANDGTVDASGNFVTGTLRAETDKGSTWCFSSQDDWTKVDGGITNANGHVSLSDKLVFADSPAQVLWAYDSPLTPTGGVSRKLYADTRELDGYPDGACQTNDGQILSCIIRAGRIALYSDQGLQRSFEAGSEQPSDVTFGGANLDRLFVVSIKIDFGHGVPNSPLAGTLVEIEGSGLVGLPENRFKL